MKKVLGLLLVFSLAVFTVQAEKQNEKITINQVVDIGMACSAIVLPAHPTLLRYSGSKDDTLSLLFIDQVFQHYVIEDEFREIKVKGETRIPAGIYPLELRKTGGKDAHYARLFPDIHKGMIHLCDVPNFKYILYHIMNKDEDTQGCIGGGDTANNNQIGKGFVGNSKKAYKRTYPKFLTYMESTDNPIIEIIDLDRKHT